MDSLFLHSLYFWKPLGYLLIFLGMIFEGDILLFTTGFLVSRHIFGGAPVFSAIILGVLLGDSLWYWFGYWLNHSPNRFNRWLNKLMRPLDGHILQWSLRTIFISKFIYGIHHLILIRAGILKLPFKKYLRDDAISASAWILIVGGLGYLSGASFGLLKHYLRYIEVGFVFAVILFFTGEIILSRYFRERL